MWHSIKSTARSGMEAPRVTAKTRFTTIAETRCGEFSLPLQNTATQQRRSALESGKRCERSGKRQRLKTECPEITAARRGGAQMISLSRAMLCVNCELISETERDCPSCGSKQLMAVIQMLGGSLLNQAKNPSAAFWNETQARHWNAVPAGTGDGRRASYWLKRPK